MSVVTFGMNNVWYCGTHTAAGGTGIPFASHGVRPSAPWVRTGKPAASTAAGFVEVWSTIRLLMRRGSESNTNPPGCAYDVVGPPGGPNKPGSASAGSKRGVVRRGKSWCDAPNVSWPDCKLLHVPSTVRRPNDNSGLPIWSGPGPTSAPHGPVAAVVFSTWYSAILICFRMKARSAAETVKPCPVGAASTPEVIGSPPATMARAIVRTTPRFTVDRRRTQVRSPPFARLRGLSTPPNLLHPFIGCLLIRVLIQRSAKQPA